MLEGGIKIMFTTQGDSKVALPLISRGSRKMSTTLREGTALLMRLFRSDRKPQFYSNLMAFKGRSKIKEPSTARKS